MPRWDALCWCPLLVFGHVHVQAEQLRLTGYPAGCCCGAMHVCRGIQGGCAADLCRGHAWLSPVRGGAPLARLPRPHAQHGRAPAEVESSVARKVFDLKLPELGPYNVAFTRSGRHMLLGGRKGHLALMDWQRMHSVCEVQVGDASIIVLQSSE